MTTAASAGHEIKAVILLDLTREVAITRFDAAKTLNDRGHRTDDNDPEVFKTRLEEFQEKTLPVLEHYRDLGLLIAIDGNQTREQVFADIIDQLYTKSLS